MVGWQKRRQRQVGVLVKQEFRELRLEWELVKAGRIGLLSATGGPRDFLLMVCGPTQTSQTVAAFHGVFLLDLLAPIHTCCVYT